MAPNCSFHHITKMVMLGQYQHEQPSIRMLWESIAALHDVSNPLSIYLLMLFFSSSGPSYELYSSSNPLSSHLYACYSTSSINSTSKVALKSMFISSLQLSFFYCAILSDLDFQNLKDMTPLPENFNWSSCLQNQI